MRCAWVSETWCSDSSLYLPLQVAMFAAVLDKDLSDRKRTAEVRLFTS